MPVIPEKARWHGDPQPDQIKAWRGKYFFDADNRLGHGHGQLFANIGGHRWTKIEYDSAGRATNDPYPLRPTC